MAEFITRIELHAGTWDDYEKLHSQMELAGFYRSIRDGNGKVWSLPTATYHSSGNILASAMRDRARTVANGIGRKNITFTAQINDWAAYFD